MCKYKDTTLGIKKLDFRSTYSRLQGKNVKRGAMGGNIRIVHVHIINILKGLC